MKFFSFLALFTLLFSACQVKPEESAEVELSSEVERGPLLLEASFMSNHQSFSYVLNYDGNEMQMMDEVLSDAGVSFGPNFIVNGGAEIVGYTTWASETDMVPELAAAQLYGRYQVYRYSTPDGICTVDKAVIPHLEESLILELRSCPNQDGVAGQAAFEALLNGLRIQDL
jgi:hypothetical protein